MQALIFDFDGLIVDTEWPDYESWRQIYQEHGCEFPLEEWAGVVGGSGASDFDPYNHLEDLLGKEVDREAIWIKRRKYDAEVVAQQPVLPGVEDYLQSAKRLGLKLAVASSSPESWVAGHLTRLGLIDQFDAIKTADDVEKTKPDPALFQAALDALQVKPEQAVVFEDSPNGVLAAKRAGIFAVAVPNPFTIILDFDLADMKIDSLADLPLEELLAQIQAL